MKPWKLYLALAAILVIFCAGIGLGYKVFSPSKSTTQVTAQVIMTGLRDRGFLVTQTYLFDSPVTIQKTSGSAFKDFFFGQTITARGVMEVNMGVDLTKLSADDVQIDGNNVKVRIPKASIFNVRPVGPLDVKNEQGLLKRILENENGYNEASAELSKQAENAANQPEFIDKATESAKQEIMRTLGYVAQGKTVVVELK